ncbi:MAG: primase-helicase family protein [Pseudomonadota bacterium]
MTEQETDTVTGFDDLKGWTIDQHCGEQTRMAGDEEEAYALLDGYRDNLLRRYALDLSPGSYGEVYDMLLDTNISLKLLELEYEHNAVKWEGARGAIHHVNPMKAWRKAANKTVINRLEMMPGEPARLIEKRGAFVYNTWQEPDFEGVIPDDPTIAEAGELFETFLAHLVPDKRERDHLRHWVARKVQHPEERGIAMVHVTETRGTGRNAFVDLIGKMLGANTVLQGSSKDIYGTSASSNYRDYRGVLLFSVPEAICTGNDRGRGEAEARELISDSTAPIPHNPKGQHQVMAPVYFSTFIASNDPNRAIALDRAERRFCILSGPDRKLIHAPEAYNAIKALDPRANVGTPEARRGLELQAGLYEYLWSLETCGDRFKEMIDTKARRDMVDGGLGPVDRALRDVLENICEDKDGLLLDWVVSAVKREYEGKPPNNLKRIIEEALTSQVALPDGSVTRGVEGWALLPRQTKVMPPPGSKFEKKKGFGPMNSEDPEGVWRITGLVVRERYAETYEGVPEDRGAIVSEIDGMTCGKGGRAGLKAIAGGRK